MTYPWINEPSNNNSDGQNGAAENDPVNPWLAGNQAPNPTPNPAPQPTQPPAANPWASAPQQPLPPHMPSAQPNQQAYFQPAQTQQGQYFQQPVPQQGQSAAGASVLSILQSPPKLVSAISIVGVVLVLLYRFLPTISILGFFSLNGYGMANVSAGFFTDVSQSAVREELRAEPFWWLIVFVSLAVIALLIAAAITGYKAKVMVAGILLIIAGGVEVLHSIYYIFAVISGSNEISQTSAGWVSGSDVVSLGAGSYLMLLFGAAFIAAGVYAVAKLSKIQPNN